MEQDAAVSDVRLHVETAGSGPPVVLTHGLGDTAQTWDGVFDTLAERYRVTRWDLRGHGRSGGPAEPEAYSRDAGVADLLRVTEDAGPPVALVGHSLGGYLSLYVALHHPELVRALVMVSSGPGFRDPDSRAGWHAYIDRVAASMAIAPHASRLCHQPDSVVIDALPTLSRPLLQIVGEQDVRFHAGVAYVERIVQGSTVLRVPEAGHHPQQSHPDAVVEAVTRHLAATR